MTASPASRLVRVRTPQGVVVDVAVEAETATAAHVVGEAVETALGLRGGANAVEVERTGLILGGETWGDSRVREGDLLLLRPQTVGVPTQRAADLEIVEPGQPARRVVVDVGRHTLGRDPSKADILVADETVSGAHLRLIARPGALAVEALKTTNGTTVGGQPLLEGGSRTLASGAVLTAGNTTVRVLTLSAAVDTVTTPAGHVPFNRPPRLKPAVVPTVVSVPAPPQDVPKGRIPMAAALLPLVFAGVIFMISSSQGTTQALPILFVALLSPAVMVASHLEERRHGGAEAKKGAERFRSTVTQAVATVRAADVRERDRQLQDLPGPADLAEVARTNRPGLWDRRPEDPDFLRLRVGVGTLPSSNRVALETGGSESLRAWATEQTQGTGLLVGAPATVDLSTTGSLGVVGSTTGVMGLGAWLVTQVATLHSPRDVAIAAIVRSADADRWEWLKWLPHARSLGSPLRTPAIVSETGSGDLLAELRRIRIERSARTARRGDRERSELPYLVVLVDGRVPMSRPEVSALLSAGSQAGLLFIWLGDRREDLPGECRTVAELRPDGTAQIAFAGSDPVASWVSGDVLGPDGLLATALALAPVVDVSSDQGGAMVPTRVDLLPSLGLPSGSIEQWMERQWDGPQTSIASPIGEDARGPVVLDLERHGPHGLVAGTTGSGKSETLQSIVAGVAALHPPERVTFLLIDYKGGTAFRECADLPHTVGLVTDLDGALTTRALESLKAELKRREHVLAKAGMKDLQALRKADPTAAPPSLVIVVDEFARLHEDLPDFIAGLVDVAQAGRALGVHLVLGTQSPGGIVGQSIRANIGFRIAMRTVDSAESTDVIGSDLAARISTETRGRGYLRVGSEVPVLFQGSHAGARRAEAANPVARVRPFPLFATRAEVREASDEGVTNLGEVAQAARRLWERRGKAPLHRPWLPPLPRAIALSSLAADGAAVPLGLIDEPALQRQRPMTLDLASQGGLIAYGAPQSGKTTALRTAVAALCEADRQGRMVVHALDYGTGGLRPLDAFPQVGTVVPGDDLERSVRLLRMVRAEVARRRSDPSLSRDGDAGPPPLVLVIDSYDAFNATFAQVLYGEWVEALPRLAADGRAVGVYLLMSVGRRSTVPASLVASLERRIVLRQSEPDEYASFGIRVSARQRLDLPPGRGFLEDGLEVQVATVAADGASETQAIRQAGEAAHGRGAQSARAVDVLPRSIRWHDLGAAAEPFALGVSDEDLRTVGVDLADGHLLVAGPQRSGRTNTLAALARAVRSADPDLPIHRLGCRDAVAPVDGPWDLAMAGPDEVERYLRERAWEPSLAAHGRLVVMVDDVEELGDRFSDPDLVTAARRRPPPGIWFVVAGLADEIGGIYGDWLPRLRKQGHGILLDPDLADDGNLLGIRLPNQVTTPRSTGRGFLVRRGGSELIQVALA